MSDTGKTIVLIGLGIAAVGLFVWVAGRLGRTLPGSIKLYESDRVTIYFPLLACLVISIALSVGWWIFRSLR